MNAELLRQISARMMQAAERGIACRAVKVAVQLGDIIRVKPVITDIGDQTVSSVLGVFRIYRDRADIDGKTTEGMTIRFHDDPEEPNRRRTVHISLGTAHLEDPRAREVALGALLDDKDVVFSWRGRPGDPGVVLGYIPGPWETRLDQLAAWADEGEDKAALMAEQAEEREARRVWGLAEEPGEPAASEGR